MKIDICGQEYTVSECSNSELPMNDGLFFGRTIFFDKTIFINKDACKEKKRQTLRHELTHVFLFESQINSQEKDFQYTEEMLCEFVGKYGHKIEKIAEVIYPNV